MGSQGCRILRHQHNPVANLQADGNGLVGAQASGSVSFLLNSQGDSTGISYSPYGFHSPRGLSGFCLGFNGEWYESVTGNYLLGNGRRGYSPVLMRFISADNRSPFGAGGLNYYAYCKNDPVGYVDPTGEVPSLLQLAARKQPSFDPLVVMSKYNKTIYADVIKKLSVPLDIKVPVNDGDKVRNYYLILEGLKQADPLSFDATVIKYSEKGTALRRGIEAEDVARLFDALKAGVQSNSEVKLLAGISRKSVDKIEKYNAYVRSGDQSAAKSYVDSIGRSRSRAHHRFLKTKD